MTRTLKPTKENSEQTTSAKRPDRGGKVPRRTGHNGDSPTAVDTSTSTTSTSSTSSAATHRKNSHAVKDSTLPGTPDENYHLEFQDKYGLLFKKSGEPDNSTPPSFQQPTRTRKTRGSTDDESEKPTPASQEETDQGHDEDEEESDGDESETDQPKKKHRPDNSQLEGASQPMEDEIIQTQAPNVPATASTSAHMMSPPKIAHSSIASITSPNGQNNFKWTTIGIAAACGALQLSSVNASTASLYKSIGDEINRFNSSKTLSVETKKHLCTTELVTEIRANMARISEIFAKNDELLQRHVASTESIVALTWAASQKYTDVQNLLKNVSDQEVCSTYESMVRVKLSAMDSTEPHVLTVIDDKVIEHIKKPLDLGELTLKVLEPEDAIQTAESNNNNDNNEHLIPEYGEKWNLPYRPYFEVQDRNGALLFSLVYWYPNFRRSLAEAIEGCIYLPHHTKEKSFIKEILSTQLYRKIHGENLRIDVTTHQTNGDDSKYNTRLVLQKFEQPQAVTGATQAPLNAMGDFDRSLRKLLASSIDLPPAFGYSMFMNEVLDLLVSQGRVVDRADLDQLLSAPCTVLQTVAHLKPKILPGKILDDYAMMCNTPDTLLSTWEFRTKTVNWDSLFTKNPSSFDAIPNQDQKWCFSPTFLCTLAPENQPAKEQTRYTTKIALSKLGAAAQFTYYFIAGGNGDKPFSMVEYFDLPTCALLLSGTANSITEGHMKQKMLNGISGGLIKPFSHLGKNFTTVGQLSVDNNGIMDTIISEDNKQIISTLDVVQFNKERHFSTDVVAEYLASWYRKLYSSRLITKHLVDIHNMIAFICFKHGLDDAFDKMKSDFFDYKWDPMH